MRYQCVLHLDGGDILPTGNDDVLFAVRDGQVSVVHRSAITGMKPIARQCLRSGLRLIPISVQVRVRLGQHLTVLGDGYAHTDRWGTRAAQHAGLLLHIETRPLGTETIHRDQRRRLGKPIDLDELPPQLGAHPCDGPRRRGRSGDDDANAITPGNGPPPTCGGIQYRVDHRWGRTHHGDPVLFDTAQNLVTVDLAQHNVPRSHTRRGVGPAPPVAVKHRQCMQQHIVIAQGRMQPEHNGVDPDIAMSELNTLGVARCARGVIESRSACFGPGPWIGGHSVRRIQLPEYCRIVLAQHKVVAGPYGVQKAPHLGVDHQHRSTRMSDDVLDLGGRQPKVYGHQDASPPGYAEERGEQPRAVLRNDRHPLPRPDPEGVESGRLSTCSRGELPVGQLPPGRGRLHRLIDDTHPFGVHKFGSVQEISHAQIEEHAPILPPDTRCRGDIHEATVHLAGHWHRGV
ncbi:Uncharacterised protein [Mycobacteroides abscessus subsp. abscessus]|nr:Uncharacterised protein [Mycobacteroides abscessus subsp. abscessus]